jgi:hypothetical protein
MSSTTSTPLPPVAGAARGGEDARAERPGELDRRRADARGAAMDEEGLAALQPPALEDVGPDGEEGFGNDGGLDHREALRRGQALTGRRDAIFRVAAAGDEGAEAVAGLPLHAGADRDDAACDLQPGNVGDAGRGVVAPHSLQHVRPVHPGRVDLDKHLAGAGRGGRALRGFQRLRPAGRGDLDGVHGVGEGHGASSAGVES